MKLTDWQARITRNLYVGIYHRNARLPWRPMRRRHPTAGTTIYSFGMFYVLAYD